MTRYPSDEPTQEHDFVIVVRPTQPTSLTYQVTFNPEAGKWTLTQGVRVFVTEYQRWQVEELVELTFWTCDDLMSVLRQWVDGAPGYFEDTDGEVLQSVIDRMTNR